MRSPKWLVICDNPKGAVPTSRYLSMLWNYCNFLKSKKIDVETIINTDGDYFRLHMEKKDNQIITKRSNMILFDSVDGIVVSFTRKAAAKLMGYHLTKGNKLVIGRKRNQTWSHLHSFLARLSSLSSPIVFCTGQDVFSLLEQEGYLNIFNVTFVPKNRICWFNTHLTKKTAQIIHANHNFISKDGN